MDQEITIKSLIEAGTYIGHKKASKNPKAESYVFAERKGISVIDPEKTLKCLKLACENVRKIIGSGKSIIFVGTKRQIADIIKEEAIKCNAFYCTRRWLGGTFTNFSTIRKSVEKLRLLEEQKDSITIKKERLLVEKKLEKMHRNLDGIIEMEELPGVVYIVDIKREKIAVKEALKLNIPIVAIVDTNVDPTPITYPIPANDDAIRSVKLITQAIAATVIEGQEELKIQKEKKDE
jgi:small subunit ribosomal protein S2